MMRRIIKAIDGHWFGPMPEAYLSLTRIVIFGGLLFFLLDPFPFGEPRLLAHQHWWTGTDGTLYSPIPALKVLLLPLGGWGTVRPSPDLLQAVWLVAVITAVGSILGIRTRLNMLLCAAAVTLMYAHTYSYQEFHHPNAPLTIALWVLALAPVTRTASWAHFAERAREILRTRRFRPVDPSKSEPLPLIRWPLRVIQWLLVLVYFSAGISKLIYGGLEWFNGHTLAYYLAQDGTFFLGGEGPGMWLSQHQTIMIAMSLWTAVFELTFVLAVLFPRIAWLYVIGGIALHTGTDVLQRATFYQFLPLYIVFAEPVHLSLKATARNLKRRLTMPPRRHEAPQQAM